MSAALQPEAPQPQEAVQPPNTVADNVAQWIDTNVSGGEAQPAAPAAAQPTWFDQDIPADFEHGFLKGKKNRDLWQSYKSTEVAMHKAQQDSARERRAREQADADLAAHKLALEMAAEARRGQQPPQPQGESIDAQAERLMWDQGPAAAFKFVREQHAADARRIAEETARNVTGAAEQHRTAADMTRAAADAGRSAVDALVARGIQPETIQKRFRAVISEITNPEGRYVADGGKGPLITKNYLDAWDELFGDSTAAPPAVAPVPVPPQPQAQAKAPGSRTPAPPQAPNAGLPTLSAEKQGAYEMIASRLGIDPAEYIRRIQQNTAARTK